MNFFSDKYDFELSASLVNIFIEHNVTNIGLGISPFNFLANYSVEDKKWANNIFFFLNGILYWNPLGEKNLTLGPFVSINYLGIQRKMRIVKIIADRDRLYPGNQNNSLPPTPLP